MTCWLWRPTHLGGGDLPGEERVLAQGLRGASPERRAEDVDGRAEEDVEALRDSLVADRDAEALRERGVPRGGEDLRIRERGARRRAVPDAVRSVARRQRGDAEARDARPAVRRRARSSRRASSGRGAHSPAGGASGGGPRPRSTTRRPQRRARRWRDEQQATGRVHPPRCMPGALSPSMQKYAR